MTYEKTTIPHEQEATSRSGEHKEHYAPRRRPRRGSELKFGKPKMSHAETEKRLAKAIGTQDQDFLNNLISQVVAVGELGGPSDDLEVSFFLSVIEDILSNQSNGSVSKAMLAAQYTAVHAAIIRLARWFARIQEPQWLDMIGRLLSSLARTSVAQYEALNHVPPGVTVGHVSVKDGGQAIVGSVTHNQPAPTTTQPLLAETKNVTMPIIEESEERVPVPASRTEESNR
jgi:hypothetical protein